MPPTTRKPQDRKPKTTKPEAIVGAIFSSFTWTSPGGVEITIPPLNDVPTGILRKYRNADEIDFMFALLECVMKPGDLENLDTLPLSETVELFSAWKGSGDGATLPQS